MKNKYKLFNTFYLILLFLSLLFLILDKFLTKPKIWLFSIYFWISILSWFTAISIFLFNNLIYSELNSINPIKAYKFSSKYYDKMGFSLFTGGLIVLLTGSKLSSSIGITILGITFIVISLIKRNIYEKLNENIKKTYK